MSGEMADKPKKKLRLGLVLLCALLVVLALGGAWVARKFARMTDDERHIYGAMDTRAGYYADALTGASASNGAQLPTADPASLARAPNIIVIMADDLGWSDVSTYGVGRVPTPNIDRIAQWGVAYANGYVTAPVCAPSRAGLMTGRHQQRFGFDFNIAENRARTGASEAGLPQDEQILAERLHAAGYATGLVGKWHLGFAPEQFPLRRGFDEFFGFLPGTMTYARADSPRIVAMGQADEPDSGDAPVIYDNETLIDIDENFYMTEAFGARAVSFIERHQDRPFYLHLAQHAPHLPFEVPREYAERFTGVESEEMRVYFGMIAALDDSVGEVLDALERLGLRQNTLIFFVSDNGCASGKGVCGCDAIPNAGKFTMFDGGMRVPFLMSWPARMAPGGIVADQVSTLDIAATALTAAGLGAAPEFDGVDLFSGGAQASRPMFWRVGELAAVRLGDWKLLREWGGQGGRLFNLADDPGERHDLARSHADVAADLSARLDAWEAGLAEPAWRHPQVPWRSCGRWTRGAH